MYQQRSLKECFDELWSRGLPANRLSDKDTDHSYITPYMELLEKYRNTPINFLEIGIGFGSCLEMWTNYFHQDSKIYGLDNQDFQIFKNYGIIQYADSKSIEARDSLFSGIEFDVIVEDGEHVIDTQIATYEAYFPLVKPGGIYIIEDIQNCENDAAAFRSRGYNPDVIDLRGVKGRPDDVMFVFNKFKVNATSYPKP
jgi:cephalosporin hydroxylase